MLTPQPGELIAGRYRLEGELARGGMGSVWSGHDAKLRRRVAVKLVAPEWISGEKGPEDAARDAHERFEREAMAVAQLQSPHVVQIFDYGVERSVPYIVMELLEGEDLRSRLHRLKRVSLETAALILVQTAKALSVAHAAGIVHRDLKPGNIFLVRAGEEEIVKVLDFGVAMQVTDLLEDAEQKVMGTPQFMSPEQARGLPDLDHRADLWSLGVIVYKALTGRLPFQGGSPTDVIVKVCTTDATPVSKLAPDLPRELDGFFARALAREPQRRFASAREMALAFSRISPVNFTTLSMPDPKAIEEAIARAKAAGVVDEDEAETLAVDALTMMQLDDELLEDLKTKMLTPGLIASRLPAAPARGSGPTAPRLRAPQRGALPLRPPSRPAPPPAAGAPPPPREGPASAAGGASAAGLRPPVSSAAGLRPPVSSAAGVRAPEASGGPKLAPPRSLAGAGAAPPSAPASGPAPSSGPAPAARSAAGPAGPRPPASASSARSPAGAGAGMPARAPEAVALPGLDHDDLDDDARTMPPSSRTLRAIERAPSSIPPPQTRRALAMALGAIAVGVTAAVIGSVILRGSDVAALGLVAHLEEARSAVRALAAQRRDESNPRDDGSRGADAVEPNAPEPAAEAVADEPAEAVASTIGADRGRPRPTGATARDEGGEPSSPPVAPPAVPPPAPPVPPPAAPPPAAPPPPKAPAKKPVDVFSERL